MRVIFLTLFFAGVCHAVDTSILEAWLRKQSTIRTISVSFQQIRTLPSLKNPLSTTGRFFFVKPHHIRWELGSPPATIAVSDGKTLTLIDEKKRSARRIPADSPRAKRFSLLAPEGFKDLSAFQAHFSVTDHRVASGLHQFTLQPADKKLRSEIPWVFLTIDPKSLDLRGFEIEAEDRSRIRTEFASPQLNGAIPNETFHPPLDGYHMR